MELPVGFEVVALYKLFLLADKVKFKSHVRVHVASPKRDYASNFVVHPFCEIRVRKQPCSCVLRSRMQRKPIRSSESRLNMRDLQSRAHRCNR